MLAANGLNGKDEVLCVTRLTFSHKMHDHYILNAGYTALSMRFGFLFHKKNGREIVWTRYSFKVAELLLPIEQTSGRLKISIIPNQIQLFQSNQTIHKIYIMLPKLPWIQKDTIVTFNSKYTHESKHNINQRIHLSICLQVL